MAKKSKLEIATENKINVLRNMREPLLTEQKRIEIQLESINYAINQLSDLLVKSQQS